jgi:adenylate cyclase, class 2
MAYNDQEIELKLALSKIKYCEILKKLRERAKFVKTSSHSDDYYTPNRNSFLDKKYPYEWLTVRHRDGISYINYKHWYPENTKYTTHCDEFEVTVDSKEKTEKILKALNFKKFISVRKKRDLFTYNNTLEIAMDEVRGLGYFIEVETVKNFESVETARKAILDFTKSLGLKGKKTVPGGYAAALIRKKLLKF